MKVKEKERMPKIKENKKKASPSLFIRTMKEVSWHLESFRCIRKYMIYFFTIFFYLGSVFSVSKI
jgi:hypothetical protein